MTSAKTDGPLFERVGLIYRAVRPRWIPSGSVEEMPPTHILRVVPDPGCGDEWDVDTWAIDDADAKRRARYLAGLLSPEHRVRACRYEEPHKALIGLRAFGSVSSVNDQVACSALSDPRQQPPRHSAGFARRDPDEP